MNDYVDDGVNDCVDELVLGEGPPLPPALVPVLLRGDGILDAPASRRRSPIRNNQHSMINGK